MPAGVRVARIPAMAGMAWLVLAPMTATGQTAADSAEPRVPDPVDASVRVPVGGSFADPCATQANTLEINACLSRTLAARERALDASYQALLRRLAPADRHDDTDYHRAVEHLKAAQQAWIRFRDADCQGRVVLYEGGSIRGAVHAGCLIRHAEQRTQALKDWMLGR